MKGARRGAAVGWILLLLVVLLAAGAGFFRGDLLQWWSGEGAAATTVSPEAAAEAEAKLDRLKSTGGPVRLSDVEITSLIRYRYGSWIPTVLGEPAVAFAGDTLRLGGRVPTAAFPDLPELDRVRAFLPDTAQVEVIGRLEPLSAGRSAFEVGEVTVSGVPIPARFYPVVLRRLGRRDEPGLAETAVPFALPEGVGAARVEGGYLVLTS